jgi:hypothetical protein
MVDVLYGPSAQNITTFEALKNLLTVTDPGGAGLDALAREAAKCWKCGMLGTLPGIAPILGTVPSIGQDAPRRPVRACNEVIPQHTFHAGGDARTSHIDCCNPEPS